MPLSIHTDFINYNKLWIHSINQVCIKQIAINIEKRIKITSFIKSEFVNFYYNLGVKGKTSYR
jgi:hypothetical protein